MIRQFILMIAIITMVFYEIHGQPSIHFNVTAKNPKGFQGKKMAQMRAPRPSSEEREFYDEPTKGFFL